MKSGPVIILYAVGCIVGAVTQNLPYNPTSILQDPRNMSFAYVFRPASDLSTRQLVSVDASSRLSGSNISFEILTENLPFSTDDSAVFLPSISEHGDISVYTGDCGSPATSTIWRFTNFNASRKGSGTWAQAATHTAPGMSSSSSLPRAYFLGGVFEFSTFVDANSSQTKLYMFGGMCPNDDVNATTWQTAAQYSNRMMRLSPTSDMNYSIDITTSRSSPVAEAGFSLTKLTPTYSNSSNVKTQQQNFVLIGGHTESAFISMSQIAIWSVPEEAWNFVKVEIPLTTNINSEASEDSSSIMIDSRSGHTAILTEDGSKIIVYGGWVGDTGQAAEPQLAILSLGSGYGGSGNWGWSIPSNQPPGSGRYGHGAMMLPGNVMMVTGGFNIPTHTKRALEFGTHAVFFNATSLTWSSNYTNPEYAGKESIHQVPSSLGMRIAVGLGLAAVVGVVLLCVGFKRHRKQKGQRDDNIRGLSEIATNSNVNHGREMRSTGGVFPWSNGGWNQGVDGFDSHASGSHRGPTRYENMSLAVDSSADPVYILPPPSKHILPKSSYTKLRGSYQPANYDTGGLGTSLGVAGPIHPIYEADENDEEEDNTGDIGLESSRPLSARNEAENRRNSDPFKDPQTHLASPSQQSLAESIKTHDLGTSPRERQIKEWVTECAGADLQMNPQSRPISSTGQVSPSRRATVITASSPGSLTAEEDRGSISNLSEQTEQSVHTASQNSHSSLRGFILGMNPFSSNDRTHPTKKSNSDVNLPTTPDNQLQPMSQLSRLTLGSAHSSRSGKSFRSAQTSILAPQNEGESLLPLTTEKASIRAVFPADESQGFPMIGSPSKLKPHAVGRSDASWLGSLKKALATTPEDNPLSPNAHDSESQNFDASSPQTPNENGSSREVLRNENSGGTLWRRKQGRGDLMDNKARSPTTASGFNISEEVRHSRVQLRREIEEWDIGSTSENQTAQDTYAALGDTCEIDKKDEFENVSEKSGTSRDRSKEKKRLLKVSIRDLASKRSYDTKMMDKSPVEVSSLKIETPQSVKGKEKVGGYDQSQSLLQTQVEEYEDGDISLSKKDPMLRKASPAGSPSSSTSKFNFRKSKVLEMVERMEAHS